MRVNLRVGFFENKAYTVHMNAEALRFECAEEVLEIPYKDINRVTLLGAAASTNGFSLETSGETYRGHFDTVGDAKRFLDAIGERMDGKLAINLLRL